MELASLPQIIVGSALFLSSGYALCLAAFRKGELDWAEKAVFSLAFSIMVPSIILLAANMLFKVRLDTAAVYLVYALITAIGLAHHYTYREKGHHHQQ
jgi:uncharacterized membrane protein